MTEREQKIEAVAKAAVTWVYDKGCANALMDLENAVVDLIGVPLDEAENHNALYLINIWLTTRTEL